MDLDGQIGFVRDFFKFLKKNLENTSQNFEKLEGVSAQELPVLMGLAEHGKLTVKDIAQQLSNISLSTLTRILDNLEEKQYIKRDLNPEDRRSFIVTLTDLGQQMVDSYNACMEQFARMILETLSPAERLMLIELYSKTWKALAGEGVEALDR